MANRGYVLENGRLILEGTAADLLENKDVQRAYLGKIKKRYGRDNFAGRFFMNIWDATHECMLRDELEQMQLERLQAIINRVHKNVTHYRKKFNEMGIIPEDICSLSDLTKLPLTTKDDLNLNYPYGMFAVPLREVVRIHSSSGTTSKPIVMGYTKNDIKIWSNLVARFMTAAGVTRDDVVQ